jgi:hypothetical protein
MHSVHIHNRVQEAVYFGHLHCCMNSICQYILHNSYFNSILSGSLRAALAQSTVSISLKNKFCWFQFSFSSWFSTKYVMVSTVILLHLRSSRIIWQFSSVMHFHELPADTGLRTQPQTARRCHVQVTFQVPFFIFVLTRFHVFQNKAKWSQRKQCVKKEKKKNTQFRRRKIT